MERKESYGFRKVIVDNPYKIRWSGMVFDIVLRVNSILHFRGDLR